MPSADFLSQKLAERKSLHLLRQLTVESDDWIDFSSNDYLGLAQSTAIQNNANEIISQFNNVKNGSTGSRLIAGNTAYTESLEQKLASFHQAEAALIYNSGYNANVGLLSCLAGKNDTYISDELIHASMIDGMRLSYAKRFRFKHNDLADLEKKLNQASGNKFVVIESIYSMDGDCAPLEGIVALCEKYDAHLIVDEAHGIGVFGDRGEGKVMELGLQDQVFARVYTFGKGLGCHGAVIVGCEELINYLINFSRAFIYTTALPIHALATIDAAYSEMESIKAERQHLHSLIQHFRNTCRAVGIIELIESDSAIQSVLISGNKRVSTVAQNLQAQNMWAKAIRSPTVPEGKERIRICLHAYNSKEEITQLVSAMEKSLKTV